jgi:hypothetical protein
MATDRAEMKSRVIDQEPAKSTEAVQEVSYASDSNREMVHG